jgi:hypothetical protein
MPGYRFPVTSVMFARNDQSRSLQRSRGKSIPGDRHGGQEWQVGRGASTEPGSISPVAAETVAEAGNDLVASTEPGDVVSGDDKATT